MSNFFEKPTTSKTKLWYKPDITSPEDLESSSLTVSLPKSYKKSQSTNSIRPIVFLFNQGLLYSTKKDGAIISGVLDLNYAYAEVKSVEEEQHKNVSFCITIEKRNRYTTIYLRDQESVSVWLDIISPYCVQRNFSGFYKTEGLLGEGSYGSVFLVKCKASGSLYATKAFSKRDLAAKEDAYESVINEINIMKRLGNEPNFTGYHGLFESTNSIYILMEYVKGEPIFDLMDIIRVKEHQRALILAQLARAIESMQKQNVVHRDFKPDNILLTA